MKNFLLLLVLLIPLSSCTENKLSEFQSLDLDFDGITAVKKDGNYFGEIPASGLKFVIVGKGKLVKSTFINDYCINDIHQDEVLKITEDYKPADDNKLTIKAQWGEIKNTRDNKIYINIGPNNTSEDREFMFLVGGCYNISDVRIKQPPVKTD